MNHGDVKKNLADYLEGDLALEDRALVDAHLDGCEDCSREIAEMQQTIGLLRRLPEPETPPMIAANVMRRIRAGETQPKGLDRVVQGLKAIFEPSFVLPASAIAAAALVVMVLQDPSRWTLPDFMPSAGGVAQPQFASADAAPGSGASQMRETRIAGVETIVPRSAADFEATTRPASPASQRPALNGSNVAARATRGASGVPLRTVYVDSMLSPPVPRSTVPDFYVSNPSMGSGNGRAAPPATFVMDRVAEQVRGRENPGRARAVSQSQGFDALGLRARNGLRLTLEETVRPGISSGGEDARDTWLARGLSDPVGFARYIAGKNLAEQELWVAQLSERALSRGLLGELATSLRESGDSTATWLASDFEAEAERFRAAEESAAESAGR